MLRIVFSNEDIGRTRVAPAPDPVWELVLSLHLLQDRLRDDVTAGWRREVQDTLRRDGHLAHMRLLLGLNPPRGYFPDFLTPYDSLFGLEAGLEAVRSTPATRLRRDVSLVAATNMMPAAAPALARGEPDVLRHLTDSMERYGEVAIEPYWPRLRAAVEADRARRTRALLDGGTEGLLSSLRPVMHWDPGLLELEVPDYPTNRELRLEGRGLLLVPSFFCSRTPVALVDPSLPPVLVYPIDRLGGVLANGNGTEDGSPARNMFLQTGLGRLGMGRPGAPGDGASAATGREALSALLGRTRAAVLEAVGGGSSTGEIARRLGISQAAASQHATVLRNAGLVLSQRDRNTVLHTLTPLGQAMLDGG
jgi:DNA-binding transcriptional ArsR family regulator